VPGPQSGVEGVPLHPMPAENKRPTDRARAMKAVVATSLFLATFATASGCSKSCSAGAGSLPVGFQGEPSARAALQKFLAHPPHGVSRTGWKVEKSTPDEVTYKSGGDSVVVSSQSNGTWAPTSFTACS
jgi:hypothetical protein